MTRELSPTQWRKRVLLALEDVALAAKSIRRSIRIGGATGAAPVDRMIDDLDSTANAATSLLRDWRESCDLVERAE